jgi:hypothetical protein
MKAPYPPEQVEEVSKQVGEKEAYWCFIRFVKSIGHERPSLTQFFGFYQEGNRHAGSEA